MYGLQNNNIPISMPSNLQTLEEIVQSTLWLFSFGWDERAIPITSLMVEININSFNPEFNYLVTVVIKL